MGTRMKWGRAAKPKGTEMAFPPKKTPAKGGWTHLKRQPVKVFTAEERARWVAERDKAA